MDEINVIKFTIDVPANLVTEEVQRFEKVANNAVQLYAKKNHDYGDSFNKAMDNLGTSYAVGKLFDKMNRLIALCGKEETSQVKDEAYDDTLMDMACYAIMTIAYRRKQRE